MSSFQEPTNHSHTPALATNSLIDASFNERQLAEILTIKSLKNSSATEIDAILSRVISSPNFHSEFINKCMELWFDEQDKRGDFRLRLLQAFASQATRVAFVEADEVSNAIVQGDEVSNAILVSNSIVVSNGIVPLAEIFCRICRDSPVLDLEQEFGELISLSRSFAKCAEKLDDKTKLDWNIRGYQAVLSALELGLSLVPEVTRTQSVGFESLAHFINSRLTLSAEPTIESLKVLETLYSIGRLLLHDEFTAALVTSLKLLYKSSVYHHVDAVRERFGKASRAQYDFSVAIDHLFYKGLVHLNALPQNRAAHEIWQLVLDEFNSNSREVMLAIPALVRSDPQIAEPYLNAALDSIQRNRRIYHDVLLETLAVREGAVEIKRLLNQLDRLKRAECYDNLDRLLDKIETELDTRDFSHDWLGKLAPALRELRLILKR
jgi:hypothetical protein